MNFTHSNFKRGHDIYRYVAGVPPENLMVLTPTRDELYRRIMNDPDRKHVRQLHIGVG